MRVAARVPAVFPSTGARAEIRPFRQVDPHKYRCARSRIRTGTALLPADFTYHYSFRYHIPRERLWSGLYLYPMLLSLPALR